MSDKEHDFGSLVCIYSQLLPMIRESAKGLGYAIAIHGSMRRDLDLLAVPWIDDARPAIELVEAIAQAVDGFVIGDLGSRGTISNPTKQPHGRMSWNICWGGNAFIDLSVMPLTLHAGEEYLRRELLKIRKTMSFIPSHIVLAAQEAAGLGNTIRPMNKDNK